ncbi:MAG: hypothetical protein JXR23_04310, partial [Pontiellaceae bacterium]|nr:hypothetical protein [Pontiellaceae bacterium]
KSRLIWYNTETHSIEKVLDAGENATDLTVHYGDNRIYVSNWQRAETRVFDRTSKQELEPLQLNNDVYRINAGRVGHIYTSKKDWIANSYAFDTTNGTQLAGTSSVYPGDAECTLDGHFYYYSESYSSADTILKYDVSQDGMSLVKERSIGGNGLIHLTIDGSKIFTDRRVYDSELNELLNIGANIYAVSAYGDLAIGQTKAYDGATGEEIYTLPFSATVMAFSSDQSKLVLFNSSDGSIESIDTAAIMPLPTPELSSEIEDGGAVAFTLSELAWTKELFAVEYDIYLGTSSNAVVSASTNSLEYLGRTESGVFPLTEGMLAPGTTYYWRVDAFGQDGGMLVSQRWSFTTSAIGFYPSSIDAVQFNIDGLTNQVLTVDMHGSSDAWEITDLPPWLMTPTTNGVGDAVIPLLIIRDNLETGDNIGSITLASNGGDYEIPVSVQRLDEMITCMTSHPSARKIYAVSYQKGQFESYLLEISIDPLRAERVLKLPANITDIDIDPTEEYLYAISFEDGSLSKIDLDAFDVVDSKKVPGTAKGTDAQHFHVQVGPGDIIFYLDAAWAPVAHVFDYNAGKDLSTFDNGGEGLGGLLYNEAQNQLYSWRQYGWSAGNARSWVYTLDATGNQLVKVDASSEERRDPLDSPLLLVNDGNSLINKKRRFNAANLSDVQTVYSQEIYSATPDGSLAIGKTKIFRGEDGEVLADLPASSTMQTCLSDGSAMVWYNSSSKRLGCLKFDELFGLPEKVDGILPANETSIMPTQPLLMWNDQDAAKQFRVYCGTNLSDVVDANTNSPAYQGAVFKPGYTLPPESMMAYSTYYWRIDAVGYNKEIVAGDICSFTISALSADPLRLDTYEFFADYTNSYSLSLSVCSDDAGPWSAETSVDWLMLDQKNGVSSTNLTVQVDVSQLNVGVHEASVIIDESGGSSIVVPVRVQVDPLEIVKMVSDRDLPMIYALNVSSDDQHSSLIWIDSNKQQIEKVIPVVDSADDFLVHYPNDKIYISAMGNAEVSVVDRSAQVRLDNLVLHEHVYRIGSGSAGRLVTEDDGMGNGYYARMHVWDSNSGEQLQTTAQYVSGRGTGESDPSGRYYYHADSTTFPYDGTIRKYDLSSGSLVQTAMSSIVKASRRELIMSGDGSRLFWNGSVYDADLVKIVDLGEAIYAASSNGDWACTSTKILSSENGELVQTLPTSSTVMAISYSDQKLVLYNALSQQIEWVDLSANLAVPELFSQQGMNADYAAWEEHYFPNATMGVDDEADADGDGVHNLAEYVAGTDPTSAESFLALYDVELLPDGRLVLRWESVSGRMYSVYWTSSLAEPFELLESDIPYPKNSYTGSVEQAEVSGFYKVGVELE